MLARSCILVVALAFLSGCAATGPQFTGFTPLQGNIAEVVVYRPDRFARGGVTYLLHLDGNQVASLKNAGFVAIPIAPGPHELEIRASALHFFKPIKAAFEAKPQARTYYRFEPYASGSLVVLPMAAYVPVAYNLLEVTESQALIDLMDLKHSD